jgi:hypothetical protein
VKVYGGVLTVVKDVRRACPLRVKTSAPTPVFPEIRVWVAVTVVGPVSVAPAAGAVRQTWTV